MNATDTAAALASLDGAYADVQAVPILPEGTFTATIAAAYIDAKKWDDGSTTIQLALILRAPEGQVAKFIRLNDQQNLHKTKRALEEIGYMGTLGDLPAAAVGLQGTVLDVTVKRPPKRDKPGEVWTNVWIDRLYPAGTPPIDLAKFPIIDPRAKAAETASARAAAAQPQATADDDEIPF